MNRNLWNKDYTLVVLGQIISLFGNNVLRYALPLYLLNQTGSAKLYGLVLALSFIPMILFAPIGGIVADRVNKRNVMVGLDFLTAAVVTLFSLTYQSMNLTSLLIIVLMVLYAIQGAYQPAVQASIPILVSKHQLIKGNAIINMVNSLAGILGPVLGGLIFAGFGLQRILYVGIVCFVFSATMECFISIPYTKRQDQKRFKAIVKSDLNESLDFIFKKQPQIGKAALLLTTINLVFSALVIIGMPILINLHLGFNQDVGNRLYGYAQGMLALGGLSGGLLVSLLGNRIKVKRGASYIFFCTLTLLPIGLVIAFNVPQMAAYLVIVIASFLMMLASTVFNIITITAVQKMTPVLLIGKVMAFLTGLVLFGNPIGQLIYGYLFDSLAGHIEWIYYGAFVICLPLTYIASKIYRNFEGRSPQTNELIDPLNQA